MQREVISEYRKEGMVVAALVFTLLMLILLFRSHAKVPEMDVNEGGVEVQLGEPDMGGPDDSPITESTAYVPPEEASADEVVSSDLSDVNVQTSNSKTEAIKKPVENKKPVKKVDQTITDLMNKKKNSTDKSAGEGDGTKPGDQGDPKGTGDKLKGDPGTGANTKGVGSSLVEGHSLNGRRIVADPKLKDSYKSKGKVVVDILVNSKGQVVSATPGARGTTANDSKLFEIAIKLAYETKFSPLGSGKSQNGTITFKFGLK